jgi:predicted lipoprotein with Yx(FWY)xxD motif
MSRATAIVAALAVIVAATAGCGGGSGSSSAAPTTAAKPAADTQPNHVSAPKPTGTQITLGKSDYGKILADGRGRALYLFTHDTAKSRCYDACASAWPPFLTKGQPRATGSLKQGPLGTVKRTGGKTQVTYNGHPLYYYVGDRQPGQVLCQGVLEYGGYWYVVDRTGNAVQ